MEKRGIIDSQLAIQKRTQLINDGYGVIDDVVDDAFLVELQRESDRMLDAVKHPPEWKYQGSDLQVNASDEPVVERLIHWQPARDALQAMGLGDFESAGQFFVLSKPPGGPPLYWHQDWADWNDPISAAPWPQYLFLSYYLVDTSVENGCLRVIPGTHLKRIALHDRLVPAHADGGYHVGETHPDMFCDHPDAVDVPVKAGALVIAEGRVLHAARANQSAQRRTLLLCWHRRPPTVPAYWTGEVPESIRQRKAVAEYERTRVPGKYLV